MPCGKCADIANHSDAVHVIKKCEGCGRELRVPPEPGAHGIGIKVNQGEQLVMPAGSISLAFNPLKSNQRFTKPGLQWFAEMVFVDSLPGKNKDVIEDELQKNCKYFEDVVETSELIKESGLDHNNPEHFEKITQLIQENRATREWWANVAAAFARLAKDAMEKGDVKQAAWATACAERCRSMLIFKDYLEEVVWMGQSSAKLIDLLTLWDNHRTNSDEEFWQIQLTQYSYVLSQIFSVPVVLLEGKAYVGGMQIDRNDAKFVDFAFSSESSREILLIEIKTPLTKLLGKKYRGIHNPSVELSGSVVQAMDYRIEIIKNLRNITHKYNRKVEVFNPKCVLIAGDADRQLTDENKRKSFELFRSGLRDIEVVTYDELFRKAEILATLFNLVRPS